jgi:hypothetical protein
MLFNLSFSPFKVPGDFSNITVCACTKIAGTDVPVGDCICALTSNIHSRDVDQTACLTISHTQKPLFNSTYLQADVVVNNTVYSGT